jgi:hypothetical protein
MMGKLFSSFLMRSGSLPMKSNYFLYLTFFTIFLNGGCWDSQQNAKPFTPIVVARENDTIIYCDEGGKPTNCPQDSRVDLFRYEDVADTGLYGYKDDQGHIKIAPKFSQASNFTQYGWAEVNFGDRNFYRINRDGNIIHQAYPFDNGADYFNSGLTRIVNLRKIGFSNLKGETVIPPQFDGAWPFWISPSIAVVCQGCYEVGSARKEGKRCHIANGDCYTEYIGGKWGAIDTTGNIVVPIEYDKADVTKDSQLSFQKGNEEFVLFHDGEGHFRLKK